MKKPALVALLVLLPLTAHAEIFRCEVTGRTTFQDYPCEAGTSSRVNTNTLTVLPSIPPSSRPQDPAREVTPFVAAQVIVQPLGGRYESRTYR
ncbi:DUF4124 domain-containing protein [Vreelandella stevensii]|uniref:DUF4124 domain-containing protein n=1 Tax=Vreelandella stevensii TaxID=502821 RepID=UPI0037485A12